MPKIISLLLVPLFLMFACKPSSPGGNGAGNTDAEATRAFQVSHPRVTVPPAGDESRTVTVATADRVATLDPHNTESGGDVKVINQIYQTLVRIDPDTVDRLIPELAASWTVADDGMSIDFQIRPDVVFHDGAPLDANAAKLSLDRLRGTYHDVPAAPYRGFFRFIESIDADGMTLTVHLTRTVARVALRNLSMFAPSIISPRLLEATKGMASGEASTFISEWASGTGPYFLSKLDVAEGRVRLRAFENYWGGPLSIEKIVFRHVADPNTQIEYLKAGEADMLDDVPRPVWAQLDADPAIDLYRWWALNICYLGVNVKHPMTDDLRIRQAIRMAIDRDELLELYYGSARPNFSLLPQAFGEYDPEYNPVDTSQPLIVRHENARQLLDQASALGREMKIYYPMNPRPYLPTPEKVADKLRQQLNAIGLNVQIEAVPNKELFESIRTDRYEMVLIGWMSDNADPDNFYLPLAGGNPESQEPAPTNVGRAFHPQVQAMIEKAQAITEENERKTAYRAIERKLQTEIVGYIPLLNTQQGMAFGPRLQGVEVDPVGHYRFDKATLR